jgi:ABC-type uncharacterized transport system substrate-binding protein
VISEIRRTEDIASAFEMFKGHADALYVVTEPLVATHRIRINTLALAARLPTMYASREYVEAAGSTPLRSKSVKGASFYRQLAEQIWNPEELAKA